MLAGSNTPSVTRLYEQDGEGGILVTDDGRTGRFVKDGSWIEGELREADPQMCNWIAGPLAANHRLGAAPGQETHRLEHE